MTRRDLLKSGLVATAGLIDGEVGLPTAKSEAQVSAAFPASSASELDELSSPAQRLLLDFGWRFHLGNADDATKDFRYGAPMRERKFSKAGQDWLHNPTNDSLQHSFDDSAWRGIDLPHDWAVELPYITVDGAGESILAAHGGKALGKNYLETSIGWYQRTFDIPANDEGMRISIEFDGVFRDSVVLFNRFIIGRNLSGYAPFSFDIPDYVKYGGSNVITVRVNATLNEGWYYEGAGSYRHTWLTKKHPLHFAQWGTFVQSDIRQGAAHLSLQTEVVNDSGHKLLANCFRGLLTTQARWLLRFPPQHSRLHPGQV